MRGILARAFDTRATAGQGFHVSQQPPGWVETLGGWSTAVGKRVSPDVALQATAVYACVRILSETIASLPLPVYQRLPGGGKARARDHYLYSVLHDRPNAEMSSFEFRETLMGHVALWGNGYAEKVLDNAGRVRALWPLRPDRMRVKREEGELVYYYRLGKPDDQGRTGVKLPAYKVWHIRGLGFDGINGYSPIGIAKQAVGLTLATEEFGARFFGNGARPGTVLEHPGKLTEDAHNRLRSSWEETHQGLENAHRTAILEEGMKVSEIGMPPEEAQFLQTRKFQISEIARLYRVPPHMLADLDRATFSNIEHQSIEFVIHTIRPWLVRWEQGINGDILTEADREKYFAEFLVEGLLRGDIGSRYAAYAMGRQNGWLSANDVRRLENMNPIEDGDVYLIPLNMIPAGQAGESLSWEDEEEQRINSFTDPAASTGLRTGIEERAIRTARARHRLARAHRKLYEDVARRFIRREINDVGNAARRFFKQRDYGSFSLWLEEFYRDHIGFVANQMRPVANSYGELVAAEAQGEIGEPAEGVTPQVSEFIESYIDSFAARHSNISEARIRATVREALDEGLNPVDELESLFLAWQEARPAETARWESVRFNNALAVGVYLLARRQSIRWFTFGDSCPYCNDLGGKIVGIKQFFIPAGTEFQPEGAERPLNVRNNVGHPPAHDGCDCMVMAA